MEINSVEVDLCQLDSGESTSVNLSIKMLNFTKFYLRYFLL